MIGKLNNLKLSAKYYAFGNTNIINICISRSIRQIRYTNILNQHLNDKLCFSKYSKFELRLKMMSFGVTRFLLRSAKNKKKEVSFLFLFSFFIYIHRERVPFGIINSSSILCGKIETSRCK